MKTALRSHVAREMGEDLVGTHVRLCGWIEAIRDHGGILFFHLREASGKLQVVVYPKRVSQEVWKLAESLHKPFARSGGAIRGIRVPVEHKPTRSNI